MLKILGGAERGDTPCALLLGGFDGLHLGHVSLLSAARETGLPVGLTTIAGGKPGGELFTVAERRLIFERAGVQFAVEYDFSESFRGMSPESFLQELFSRVVARALFCGEDFRFGENAAGTPELLRALAPCSVTVLPLHTLGGEKIASSRIKQLLAAGDLPGVNARLAHPYFVQGRVEHGRHVGGPALGFPTVNLSLAKEKTPPLGGVYGGYAETPSGRFPAIVNIGARPTFGVTERKIEAYLDGFSGDLYGAEVRVYPAEFYRPTMEFASVGALKAQLGRDIMRLRGER